MRVFGLVNVSEDEKEAEDLLSLLSCGKATKELEVGEKTGKQNKGYDPMDDCGFITIAH